MIRKSLCLLFAFLSVSVVIQTFFNHRGREKSREIQREEKGLVEKKKRMILMKLKTWLLVCVLLLTCVPVRSQVRPVYSRGASGLGHLLMRLQTTASAMHTAAHPDDEDTALIARLARGDHARVTYLSLNRGEGGQNIIGSELFEPLGVIRTEELLQARTLDGGSQMFTRAFDYGFTKTRDEAATKWGEQIVLGDMVRAIRKFRPLIILSRFSGTPADGHGHHQLAGYLTPLAYKAAADATQFPEHFKEGLQVWQAKKLYVGQSFRANPGNEPTLRVETGVYDFLTGRSYAEIAAEGRSQHKSQEMGSLELRGAQSSGLRLLDSKVNAVANDKNVFDGIDVSITGIKSLTGLTDNALDADLKLIQTAARTALESYSALNPSTIIKPLAEGLRAVRNARVKLKTNQTAAKRDADFLLEGKEREFSEALQRAAGLEVDALADAETVVAGDALNVTVRAFAPSNPLSNNAFNAASNNVVDAAITIKETRLRAPDKWTTQTSTEPTEAASSSPFARRESATRTDYFKVQIANDAAPTSVYWLRTPRTSDVFDWSNIEPETKNEPFAAPVLQSVTRAIIGGEEIEIARPVQYRLRDDIRGELRREINIVPAVSVAFDAKLQIAPIKKEAATQRLAVRVTNNAARETRGQARLRLPSNWTAQPASQDFVLTKRGELATLFFEVMIPANAAADSYKISAEAVVGNQIFNQSQTTIAYPHIQSRRYYTPAETVAQVFDLQVAPVRVGYIAGSGDEVPEAIRRMGLSVTLLEENDLVSGDLSRFDCIVVGVRASEVRPDFVANNKRLMSYVEQGGTMIVQYQRPDYINLNLPPFPAQMAARVTDETAPVKILEPNHPVFNFPNKISERDFQGWVQERNLYAFTTFDNRYTPLLESSDPNEAANRGGQVIARIGKGNYIYTAYAWFRQLPSGVPGAYRQFANLLSLPKAEKR